MDTISNTTPGFVRYAIKQVLFATGSLTQVGSNWNLQLPTHAISGIGKTEGFANPDNAVDAVLSALQQGFKTAQAA